MEPWEETGRLLSEAIGRDMDEMTRDIIALIGVPSVSQREEPTGKALDMVLRRAEEMGFETRRLCGGTVGTVTFGRGTETVGILAHVDVVPEGDPARWTSPPFAGRVRDGRIFGRGALDDKGPLFAALYAMRAVKESGLPLVRRVQLILGTREETVWTDMDRFRRECPLPDFGFTPDGEFPVFNGEKGYADVALFFPPEAPGDGEMRLTGLESGDASNVIPETARAGLAFSPRDGGGSLTVTARGRSVHSSVPQRGDNAIWTLCRALERLKAGGAAGRCAAFVSRCLCGDFYGGGLGLPPAPPGADGTGRTVVSPTVLRGDGAGCRLVLNYRIAFPVTRAQIEEGLRQKAEVYGFTYEITEYMDPLFLPEETPFLQTLARVYTGMTGETRVFGTAQGISYAHALPNVVAFGPLFPGDPDSCHEADESIGLESLKKAAQIYARAIAALAAEREPAGEKDGPGGGEEENP